MTAAGVCVRVGKGTDAAATLADDSDRGHKPNAGFYHALRLSYTHTTFMKSHARNCIISKLQPFYI